MDAGLNISAISKKPNHFIQLTQDYIYHPVPFISCHH